MQSGIVAIFRKNTLHPRAKRVPFIAMVAITAALMLFSFGLCVSSSRGQGIMGKPVPVRSTARKTVEWKCEHPGNIDDGFANPPFDKVR